MRRRTVILLLSVLAAAAACTNPPVAAPPTAQPDPSVPVPSATPVGAWSIPAVDAAVGTIDCYPGDRCIGRSRTELVEWDGQGWTGSTLPVPDVPAGSLLADLACPAPDDCLLMTIEATVPVFTTSLRRWDGVRWTTVSLPPGVSPRGGTANLTGIECPVRGVCLAYGALYLPGTEYTNGSETFVFRLDGAQWTDVSPPRSTATVLPASDIQLECPTATFCVLVGRVIHDTQDRAWSHPFVQHWNGSSWTGRSDLAFPEGRFTAGNQAIDCTSPTFCVATGFSQDKNQPPEAEIVMWNGAVWRRATLPPVTPARTFSHVDCASPTSCLAVGGGSYGELDRSEPRALTWDGTEWRHAPGVPGELADAPTFYGVGCTTTSGCVATTEIGTVRFTR